jgi:hypothetical protein
MGKIVTLPMGLKIQDVSAIGNTQLVGTDTYLFTNIAISQIRSFVGGYSGSSNPIRTVCTSPNLNRWAAFKPWRRGLGGTGHGMMVVSNNIAYTGPIDSSAYYMTDFAGYNHNAPIPGILTHTALNFTFNTSTTHYVDLYLRFPEFNLTQLNVAITRVYFRVYKNGVLDTTSSIAINNAHLTDKVLFRTIAISASGTSNFNYQIKIHLGTTISDSTINFPNSTLGECVLSGTATYATTVPPVAHLVLGNDFATDDILMGNEATITTTRNYTLKFGYGTHWLEIYSTTGSYQYTGYFEVWAKSSRWGTSEVQIASYEQATPGVVPNWSMSGQFSSLYPVQNGDLVQFIIRKAID